MDLYEDDLQACKWSTVYVVWGKRSKIFERVMKIWYMYKLKMWVMVSLNFDSKTWWHFSHKIEQLQLFTVEIRAPKFFLHCSTSMLFFGWKERFNKLLVPIHIPLEFDHQTDKRFPNQLHEINHILVNINDYILGFWL